MVGYTQETGKQIVTLHDRGNETGERLSFAEIGRRLGLGEGALGKQRAYRWYKKAKKEMDRDFVKVRDYINVAEALPGAVAIVETLSIVDEKITQLSDAADKAWARGDELAAAAHCRVLREYLQLRARIEPADDPDRYDFAELVRIMWWGMSEVPIQWRNHVFDKVVERFGAGIRRLYMVKKRDAETGEWVDIADQGE